jgi:hypothetical protein
MKRLLIIISISFACVRLFSQTGGDNTYEFLNLTHSAFAAATGGLSVSHPGSDLSLPYHNPALLNSSMRKDIALSYSRYLAGINYGYAAYGFGNDSVNNYAAGIAYINYGSFTEADEAGNITGTFTAAEYAFNLIYSRTLDSLFTVGVDVKPVLSHLEKYFSAGICADIGITYINKESLLSAGVVIRNAGFQIKTYTGDHSEPLPFEIQAGVTKQLAHAPLRFTLTLRHLEKYDLTYNYDTENDTGSNSVGENLMRHMVLGVELLPVKNFWAGAGFNYQRRAELRTTNKTGSAGLSWGFGFNARAFTLAFGRDTYHLAGAANHFSLVLYPEMIFKNHRR